MTLSTAPPDPTPAADSPELAVELRSVSRGFGEVKALDDLTLLAPADSITVLLGPNGAGKTTAIRMITGALDPDEGAVRVFGLDPSVDGEEVRTRCGVVSAKPALYDRLSGWDNLLYSAELYGLGRGDVAATAIRESAARFGIEQALDQQVGGYSTGMKTRLALARSVMHGPDLLLFDEPTSGLDPESSHAVLELIREMADSGSTVVMCTHLLLEAEGLAEQVVVLDAGTDLIAGPPSELTKRFWPNLVVRLDAEEGLLRLALEFPAKENSGSETVAASRSEYVLRCPEGVRTDGIQARLADGILEVSLPKEEVRKPVSIEIR